MTAENNGGHGIKPGDPKLPTDRRHSYEEFTQRRFYKDVNRKTLALAPLGNTRVLDVATGTGGMIELMFASPKLLTADARVHGVDIDSSALIEARGKFRDSDVTFSAGRAEQTGMSQELFDLVSFCNAIHLTNVPESLAEVYRVLKPEGTLIANSAFVDGVGYPTPDAERLWRNLGSRALRKAIKEGYRPVKGTDFVTYTVDEYKKMAEEAGFVDVEMGEIEANMDREDVLAICHYDEFAKGALPGVPLEVSHRVLAEAADEVFIQLEEMGQPKVFPRNWVTLKARKK